MKSSSIFIYPTHPRIRKLQELAQSLNLSEWVVWLSHQTLEGKVYNNYASTLPTNKDKKVMRLQKKQITINLSTKLRLIRLAELHTHSVSVNCLFSAIADGLIITPQYTKEIA